MDTVLTLLLVRFGLIALGIVLLALLATAALAIARRSLRTPESRDRASSLVRSASDAVERRSSGAGTRGPGRRIGGPAGGRRGRAAARTVTGHDLLEHLVTDLLVKGAIVLVALALVALLGVALWRRLS